MPYAKRYNKSTTKRYSKRRYSNTRVLAKKALRIAKKAYKLPELKYNALNLSPGSISGTGSITALDTVTQGQTNNTRIGDQLMATSVKYRASLKLNASATDTLVRMMIVRWVSEAPSVVTDVLETPTVNSFKSENNRFSSQVLLDRVYRLSTAEKPEIFIRGSVKLGKMINYDGGAATSNRNGVYVIFVSDEAVNTPTIAFSSRLYFRDA